MNCMEKYEVTTQECLIDQKSKSIDDAANKLISILKADKKMVPANNSLIVLLYAGLGAQSEGQQVLVQNELHPKTGKVRMYMAEAKLRQWSEIFHNAYIICVMACDRHVYQDKIFD